jgi:peptidoglycan hydrolase-like protein with peptidoglycan-binding domain
MVDIPNKNLKIGDKDNEVKKLHGYLKRFGYMKPDEPEIAGFRIDTSKAAPKAEDESAFETNTQESVRKFQEFNKLQVTGILDEATLKLMSKPRCGVPDFIEGNQVNSSVAPASSSIAAAFSIVGRWSRTDLTYRFENTDTDLPPNSVRTAIINALNQWSNNSPLSFSEVANGGDIRIGWFEGNHGDGNPFDGTPPGNNTLAHAFFPENGRLHFDKAETWTDNNPPRGIDLESVCLHELGHSLGLGHSSDTNAVMHAFYSGILRNLQADDIAGIQTIYGA